MYHRKLEHLLDSWNFVSEAKPPMVYLLFGSVIKSSEELWYVFIFVFLYCPEEVSYNTCICKEVCFLKPSCSLLWCCVREVVVLFSW